MGEWLLQCVCSPKLDADIPLDQLSQQEQGELPVLSVLVLHMTDMLFLCLTVGTPQRREAHRQEVRSQAAKALIFTLMDSVTPLSALSRSLAHSMSSRFSSRTPRV